MLLEFEYFFWIYYKKISVGPHENYSKKISAGAYKKRPTWEIADILGENGLNVDVDIHRVYDMLERGAHGADCVEVLRLISRDDLRAAIELEGKWNRVVVHLHHLSVRVHALNWGNLRKCF